MLDIVEWNSNLLKGRIASHVARGTDNRKAIIKSIRTTLAKGNLAPEALPRILDEVERDSVQPFLKPPWNQPERLERFRLLKIDLFN
ncbi:MAG: hypothetical protein ACLQBA_22525 [Candidatus Binataceae bacterium]